MPAGNEAVVAGQYLVTWNGSSMGMFEGDAGCPALSQVEHEEPVNNTDRYGRTKIDGFYLGGDWFFDGSCIEWLRNTVRAWWPFGANPMEMGTIARRRYDMSAPLLLTAIAGTPAANSPATITAAKALLAANFNTRLLFGPTLRKLPIRQELMPYKGGAGAVWGTMS